MEMWCSKRDAIFGGTWSGPCCWEETSKRVGGVFFFGGGGETVETVEAVEAV